LLTAQNVQLRVHVSPRIRNVAVCRVKQSPIFGQRALWQMVCSRKSSSMVFISAMTPGDGILFLNQAGKRSGISLFHNDSAATDSMVVLNTAEK